MHEVVEHIRNTSDRGCIDIWFQPWDTRICLALGSVCKVVARSDGHGELKISDHKDYKTVEAWQGAILSVYMGDVLVQTFYQDMPQDPALLSNITQAHREAMSLAEQADTAKKANILDAATELFKLALAKEISAISMIPSHVALEPTRSVLYRSAASLALEIGAFRQAEQLACKGLSGGDVPDEIALELRQILNKIWSIS